VFARLSSFERIGATWFFDKLQWSQGLREGL
jgi:hypothetical protein